MSQNQPRIALKVDCDTFEGTKVGLPQLIRLFGKKKIRASFFFTLGPDRSGRAIRRIFTHKGFLKKMLRSNAVSMYGPKTLLYGTLLPAPMIGKKCHAEIKSIFNAGHDVGVHGWDHVYWHDYLGKMNQKEVENEYSQAHQVFENIFGFKAHSSAAPGWHATETSLRVQEKYNLLYTSNTRIGNPFFPKTSKHKFKTLEIPTTLPTWDEKLGDPQYKSHDDLLNFYKNAVKSTEIHTIHTEVEGTAYLPLFEKQLDLWISEGFNFLAMDDLAKDFLKEKETIPHKEIARITIPNRGGHVSSSNLS